MKGALGWGLGAAPVEQCYIEYVTSLSPVGYWHLDPGPSFLDDFSGGANTLTNPAPPNDVQEDGVLSAIAESTGSANYDDNTDQFLTVANYAGIQDILQLTSSVGTVMFWGYVAAENPAQNAQGFLCKCQTDGSNFVEGWSLEFTDDDVISDGNPNSLRLIVPPLSGGVSALMWAEANDIPYTTWSHIAVTKTAGLAPESGGIKMYINGVERTLGTSAPSNVGQSDATFPLSFGLGMNPSNRSRRPLIGNLDHVSVFDKALSSSEISDAYAKRNCTP